MNIQLKEVDRECFFRTEMLYSILQGKPFILNIKKTHKVLSRDTDRGEWNPPTVRYFSFRLSLVFVNENPTRTKPRQKEWINTNIVMNINKISFFFFICFCLHDETS